MCDQKALTGKILYFFSFILITLISINNSSAQTPITNNNCDPRSTVNGGACPTGCSFTPAVEKGCNCFDNIDNDGDGRVDAADISDCAQYFGLTFVGPGTSNCSLVPPGGNVFAGIGAPAQSQQNTADTQSKVAAGDITGDGVPETVITSKWNNEVRVVNPNGTINASYNLSGKKSLFTGFTDVDGKVADPDRLLLEHEVLIVDIKRAANQNPDKKGEIFAIVSARKGNPKSAPTGFYLLALTWTKPDPNGLQLLYDPVPLGTNRPGIFGVADMDGDGLAEIYLRDRIYAAETGKLLASDGSRTHLNTTNWDSDVTSAPVAVNVQGDARMELVCGTRIFSIPSLTNRNPATPAGLTLVKDMNVDFPATKCFVKLMNDPAEYGVDTHSSTSVADIDRDGSIDVIISGALNSSLGRTAVFYWNIAKNKVDYVLTPNSTELGLAAADPNFTSYSTGWIWGAGRVNIGDANGDGKSDFTLVAGNQLFCFTTNAADKIVSLWTQNPTSTLSSSGANHIIGYRSINDSRSGVLTATIYDFDNNGQPEMVYRDSQSLNVIDGATGQNLLWSVVCQSHTYTEGPIIADVNGDGATDICVTCATAKFDINDDIQQQALGQIRIYYTNGNTWLPTRKVWNQPGYFVVNINDNLTLPFPQLDQSTVFGTGNCANGLPGPQRPMNVFLNQVPFLNANGCPVFPAPDLTFSGDDPNFPGVDTNGDGVVEPAVIVTPPICGNLDITVQVRYGNIGDIPISDLVPVSFFKGDPRLPGAIRLHNTTITITDLQVGASVLSNPITFNGSGETFDMFIALYNDGSVLPIAAAGQSTKECTIENNVYKVLVTPSPFTAQINKFKDNIKCVVTDPNAGELRARVFIGPTEVFDFSPYAFQWYAGAGTTNPIPAGQGGQSPVITGLVEGTYTLVVTNTQKGCVAAPVSETITLEIVIPTVNVIPFNQTQCNPPNGKVEAQVDGGNTGFSFQWFSNAVSLGITTSVADGLKGDNYTVVVTRNGCTAVANAQVLDQAIEPDAEASVLQNVIDCSIPQSGSVTAQALLSGVVQNPAEYTFNWYFYNNVAGTRGSILPAINGTGPTRTGLAIGFYQLEVIRISTQCISNQSPVVEITNSTILPTAVITETLPQTSCDPANPNGVLTASVLINGLPQNTADFTFEWFRGDNTLPANLHTTISGVKGSVAEKVAGGGIFYTVKVTSALNCSATEKLIISEDVNLPVVTLAPTDNTICDPGIAGTNYNGSVTASVTFKGVAVTDFSDYKFVWHNGSQVTDPTIAVANDKSPSLTQLNGGYYTVTAERLSLGCKSLPETREVKNLSAPPVIVMNAIGSTNCTTAPNGQALVSTVDTNPVSGPTGILAPYAFEWFTGNTIASPIAGAIDGILEGRQGAVGAFFTVRVTNLTNGCRNTAAVEVPDNRVIPNVTLIQTPNSICDASLTNPAVNFNGTVAATITNQIGAIGNYTFTWHNGQQVTDPVNGTSTSQNLVNLNGGYYTTTSVHTLTGCVSAPANVQVLNNQLIPVIASNTVGSTNCDPALANGQAVVSDVDGAGTGATFVFQWHTGANIASPIGGATAASLANRQGGVGAFFTVRVTNQTNGCRNTATVEIPDNRIIPNVSLIQTPNSICDPSLTNPAVNFNGTVAASITNQIGAIGNYTFTWHNGQQVTDPVNGTSTSQNLVNVNGGYYTTTTLHTSTGCVSPPANIQVLNNSLIPVIASNAVGSTNCDPALANGQAEVSDVDGAGIGVPYVFQWHTGVNTTSPIATATAAILANRQGAVGAFFTVRVINETNGCQNTSTVEVPDNRVIPLVSLATTPNTICNPALTSPVQEFTGTATATITNQIGAIADYTFVWTDNETNTLLNGFAGPNLSNRDSSRYTVITTHTVTGCISAPVNAQILNTTSLPAIVMSTIGSTNCDPAIPNGNALVASVDTTPVPAPSGLLFPYAFEWFSGNNTSSIITGANDGILESRQGGIGSFFTTRVTNQSNGCQNTAIVEVPDNRIIPQVTLAPTPNAICNPALTNPFQPFTGTVSATVTNQIGAIANYTFVWRDNETNTLLAGFTGPLLTERDSSRYSVVTTHLPSGCVSTPVNTQVLNISSLPAIVMGAVPSTNCDPLLPNGNALVATIDTTPVPNPSGVLAPYAFEWFAGNTTTTQIAGANDGILEGRQGGIGSFFTTRVTNQSNGCQNTSIVEIQDNQSLPVLTLGSTDNKNCSTPFDGTAFVNTITYQGAAETTAGYTFNWVHGSTTSTATELNQGTYELRATRIDVGCISDPVQVFVNNNLYIPLVNVDIINQTSCDINSPNGGLSASINETSIGGGTAVTAGYNYSWVNNGNPLNPAGPSAGATASITGLNGNIFYTVTVERTATRCTNTQSVFLPERIRIPRIELVATDVTDCNTPGFVTAKVFIDKNDDGDNSDAGDELSIADINAAYSFNWFRGSSIISGTPLSETDRILNEFSTGIPLPVGNYTAFTTNTITKCISPDFTDVINGPGPLFDIDVNVNFRPASCAADEGVITAYINDAGVPVTTGFTFEWYTGSITNGLQTPPPSFYTSPVVSFNGTELPVDPLNFYGSVSFPAGQPLPSHQQPTGANTGPTLYGRPAGTYTVVATRDDGCKEYLTTYLPFLDEPVIIVADIKPDDCLGENGQVGVDLLLPAGFTADQYKVWLIPGSNPTLTPTLDPVPATPFPAINPALASGNLFTGLGPGIYTIVAQEDITDIGSGCYSSPVLVEMREALPPILNAVSSTFNTSCVGAPGDGSLQITFTTDPADPFNPGFPPPPPPIIYSPGLQNYSVDVVDGSNAPVFSTGGFTSNSGDIVNIPNLANGDFTVTVVSSQGCDVTKTFTVPWNPKVADLSGDVAVLPALYCDPLLEINALIEIKKLAIAGATEICGNGIDDDGDGLTDSADPDCNDNLSDYEFSWFTDATLNTNILTANGDNNPVVKGGEVLSNVPPLLPSVKVTAGSYWVRAAKVNAGATGGVGCLSSPLKIDIEDESVIPVALLTPAANTSCEIAGFFEGSLKVEMINAGSVATPDYTYVWTTPPASPIANGTGNGNGLDADDNFTGLKDGSYILQVKNNASGCIANAQTSIAKAATPIVVTNASPVDQFICNPDGNITVGANDIVVGGAIDTDHTRFDFTWAKDNANAIIIPATQNEDVLSIGNFAAIEAGSYFVKVKKRPGFSPGSGCESAPFRVDILDQSVDPTVRLNPFSNTSCDSNFEGSIQLEVTSAGSAPTLTYDYAWTTPPATPIANASGDGNGIGLDDNFTSLSDGNYAITIRNNASGCFGSAQTVINKQATPIVITNATPLDQFICNPDGSISVGNNDILVGGVVDSDHTRFDFTWTRSNITNIVIGPLQSADVIDINNLPAISADSYFVSVKKRPGLNPGSGCVSAPFRVDILDKSEDPTVTLTSLSNTSCDTNFEGSVQVEVTNAGSAPTLTYDYVWTTPAVSPIANASGDGDGLDVDDNFPDLSDGSYAITIRNIASGCFGSAQTVITKQATPIVITNATPSDQFICNPDGSITVGTNDIIVGGVIESDHTLFNFTWARSNVSNIVIGPLQSADVIDINNLPAISADAYFVSVKKRPGLNPGSGCESAPFRVDILDKSVDPTVTLTSLSNTSCDTNFEGSVKVEVTSAGSAPTLTYDYTWATPPASPIANGSGDGDGLDVDDNFPNLGEGNYVISIRNNASGCFGFAQTVITRQATPIVITNANHLDQIICNPDGSIIVGPNDINVGGVVDSDHTRFDFTWTRGNETSIVVGPLQSADVLDINNLPTISAGSYFVSVKKRPGLNPGSGCESAPFRVDILDKSVDPTVTLTSLSNTSCDTNFEGSVKVEVTSAGSAPTLTYDYTWATPPASPIANGSGDGDGLDVDDNFPNLGEGNYVISIRNNASGCFGFAQTVITRQATPILITNATPLDQLICNPDGSITVGTNDILVGGVIESDHTLFNFTWARNDVNTIVIPPTQSADVLDINNLPTVSAGSYFVSVKKRPGLNPGSGCESAPFKVDIKDLSEDPRLQFAFTPNSSCSVLLPNGVVVATATETDPFVDATNPLQADYQFNWQLNSAGLPGSILVTKPANNKSQLEDSPEGSYTLSVVNTITGCSFTTGVNVNIDLNISLPNIITVDKFEPTTCIGDGSAQVTGISVGGGPTLTGAAIDPPAFEYEWHIGGFPGTIDPNVNPLFAPLANGKYYVLVKDLSTECKSAPTEVELKAQDIIYPTIEITLTTPQISCDQTAFGTGVLEAVVTGDNPNFLNPAYTYEWFSNLTANPPNFALTPATPSATDSIADLKSGDYSLIVTNSLTGCTREAIYIVPDNTPQFQPQLALSASERTLCIGEDGSVFAGIVNINPAYPFTLDFTADLYTGNFEGNQNLPAQPDIPNLPNVPGFVQNFATPNNLEEGFYTVRVIDNNTGCISVKAIEVLDGRDRPVIDIVPENPNINCDDTIANGQLAATADGNQIAGYTFDWYTGAAIIEPATPVVVNNNRMIGFVAGDYTVRVTRELTGCVSEKSDKIVDGRVFPPAPTAQVIRDRTNCVLPNGWVTANVNGVTIAHTFNWYNGTTTKPASDFTGHDYFDRDIGPYSVTATDLITGCVSLPATVNVNDARVSPIVELTSKPALCLNPDGVVSLELINNEEVTLTDITWYNNATNAIVGRGPETFNLTAGFYTAEFITSESCEGTASVEIETEILSYNLVSVNGDGNNDVWIIDCLQNFPGNNVKVFNRSGVKVYEADGYDNSNVVFRGTGETGVYFLGDKLPDGTYFYIIDKRNGSKPITGYLELVR